MSNNLAKSSRNKTLILSADERSTYQERLLKVRRPVSWHEIENRTINQNLFEITDCLPSACVDILFLDPPYNLTKTFNTHTFRECSLPEYTGWLDSWFSKLIRVLKPTASVYICGDWRSSAA